MTERPSRSDADADAIVSPPRGAPQRDPSHPRNRILRPLRRWGGGVFEDILAALWPDACRHCGRLLEEEPPRPSRPARRWRPLWGGHIRRRLVAGIGVPMRFLCPACCASLHRCTTPPRRLPRTCLWSVTAFEPTPVLFDLIHAMKYDACRELAPVLGGVLARAAQRSVCQERPGVLVPIPLHPTRLRQRGFNQSHLLAEAIARRLRFPVVADALERHRATPALAQIAESERWQHVEGAFRRRRRLPPSPVQVWLVDDVVTSGATVRAVCAALGDEAPVAGVLSLCRAR